METKTGNSTQKLIAFSTMLIGAILMIFKIYADSEPGLIPLVLVVVGALWFFILKWKQK